MVANGTYVNLNEFDAILGSYDWSVTTGTGRVCLPAVDVKGLSHLADLARRSYTGAQICDFRGSVLVRQRNGITSLRTVVGLHRQDIVRTSAKTLATAGDGIKFWTCSKISAVALPELAKGLQRQYSGMASLMSVEQSVEQGRIQTQFVPGSHQLSEWSRQKARCTPPWNCCIYVGIKKSSCRPVHVTVWFRPFPRFAISIIWPHWQTSLWMHPRIWLPWIK